MKKRLFAALAAAAMLCSVPINTTAAEETYKKGDVSMNGVVDAEDAQLVLHQYVRCMVLLDCEFTEEQMELAAITGDGMDTTHLGGKKYPFGLWDAQMILNYYVDSLGHKTTDDIVTYYKTTDWEARAK